LASLATSTHCLVEDRARLSSQLQLHDLHSCPGYFNRYQQAILYYYIRSSYWLISDRFLHIGRLPVASQSPLVVHWSDKMSFGYSVGDSVAVGQLAWLVYKSYRDVPESFKNISLEVLLLHAVLEDAEETLSEQPLPASRQESLVAVTAGCQGVLQDLQALVEKYESLGA